MVDPYRNADIDDTSEAGPRREPGPEPRPRTPRWVVVLGVIAVILIVAVAVQLVLGAQHGPDLHGAT